MSKQVSLFKFYGNKGLKSKSVRAQRSAEAEVDVSREVQLLLKDVVQKVVAGEVKRGKLETDETYTVLKHDKWKTKFTFWDTKDGKVAILIFNLYFIFYILM